MVSEGRGAVATSELEIDRLTPRMGACIEGIDLASGLGDEMIERIRALILEHKVVFIRGQQANAGTLQSFASRLGPLTSPHPSVLKPTGGSEREGGDGTENVWRRPASEGYRSDHWHTDVTFVDRPPSFSVLQSVVVPPVGGDTLFANTVAAYAVLPTPLRQLADNLRVIHAHGRDYETTERMSYSESARRRVEASDQLVFETEHPLVRVHEDTGERSLLLGSFARHIVGLRSAESVDLIRIFQQYVTLPENVVRWRWAAGDVVIWDNRSTQHYATFDYGDAERVMQRVTVAGSIPVGIDGRQSVALTGNSSAYSSAQ